MLVTFGADGWANVVTVTGAGRPEDFDTIAQVRYQLVPRRDPKRIEFQTRRGNDLFPTGTQQLADHEPHRRDFLEPPQRLGSGRSVGVVAGADASLLSDLRRTRRCRDLRHVDDARRSEGDVRGARRDEARHRRALRTSAGGADARLRAREQARRRSDDAHRAERSRISPHSSGVRSVGLAREPRRARHGRSRQPGARAARRCSSERQSLRREDSHDADGVAAELVRAIRRINDRRHVPDKVFPFRWKPPAVES